MANKVIYLRWGDRYNKDHVERLREQVKNNCSVPYEFVTVNHCYAGREYDRMQHLQNCSYRGKRNVEESLSLNTLSHTPAFFVPTEIQNDSLREDLGGLAHFQKLLMFKFDADHFDPLDKLLYIDLDSNINGDLAYFFNLPVEQPMIAFDWDAYDNKRWQHLYTTRAHPLFNSSVLLWRTGFCERVWREIFRASEATFYQYGMVDNWLFHRFGPYAYNTKNREFFRPFDRGIVSKDGIIDTMSGIAIEDKIKCLV